MKLITTSALLAFMLIGIKAQNSNLIFFTDGGERFTLYLNSDQVNEIPLANVKVAGINMETARIRIVFDTPGIPELTKSIMIEPDMEMSAIIKKNNKGKYVIRPAGSVPVSQAEPATETVVVSQPAGSNTNTNTTTTTTSTYTTVNPDANNNANIDINVGGGETGYDMNVNMNVNDGSTQYSETTTTVTTTSPYSESGYSDYDDQPARVVDDRCAAPMYPSDYARAKHSIEKKTYPEEKMTILNQVLRSNCVSVNQVVGFMKLFTYEEDKITVAKNAYKKTVDQENYYKVNDAFTYSDSVDELNRFLENQ